MKSSENLKIFVETGSESSFRALVEENLPLVVGTARRITGDCGLAEEIAQTVFILLAKKATSLSSSSSLAGWLYCTTTFVAKRALVSEIRRRKREMEAAKMHHGTEEARAWNHAREIIDQLLPKLAETDRNAILLRFFQEKSMNEVAAELGISEEAAKKRVLRAVTRLQALLKRRGVAVGSSAVVAGLAAEAATDCSQLSATVLARQSLGSEVAAPAAASLVAETLLAWKWMKLKFAALAISASLILAVLPIKFWWQGKESGQSGAHRSAALETRSSLATAAGEQSRKSIQLAGQTIPLRSLVIRVLEAGSGQPISRASVFGFPGPEWFTDENGEARVEVPETLPAMLSDWAQYQLAIKANGYASRSVMWLCSTGGVLSTVTNDYVVRLERGIPLSGRLVHPNGSPVEKAQLQIGGSNYKGYTHSISEGKVVSPPVIRCEDFSAGTATVPVINGSFHVAHWPSDLHQAKLEFSLPDGQFLEVYTTGAGHARSSVEELLEVPMEELKQGNAIIALQRGRDISIQVADAKGTPLPGALVKEAVQWGNLNFLSTNKAGPSGKLHLKNRKEREYLLIASAPGYADKSVVVPAFGTSEVLVSMEPAQPLRLQVLGYEGAPLAGVKVQVLDYANEGLGYTFESTSNSDGRVVWTNAPATNLIFYLASENGAVRKVSLAPIEGEHRVVLGANPSGKTRFAGVVIDSKNGNPIPNFKVKIVAFDETVAGVNGEFSIEVGRERFSPGEQRALELVFEAPGYDACKTRTFSLEEGDQFLEVELVPGGTLYGTVLTPGGEPAVGATAAFATQRSGPFWSRAGKLQGGVSADSQGRFELKKPAEAIALGILHESGWLKLPVNDAFSTQSFTLKPWGRIQGVLGVNGQPLAHQQIFATTLIHDPSEPAFGFIETRTDEEGRFVLEKLPAGKFKVAWYNGITAARTLVYLQEEAVEVSAGQTAEVQLGTSGCTVRLTLSHDYSSKDHIDLAPLLHREVAVPSEPKRNNFVSVESYRAARKAYAADPRTFDALAQKKTFGAKRSGRELLFEAVPPGTYLLEITAYGGNKQAANPTHQLKRRIVIPESSGLGSIVDLGEVKLNPL